MQQLLSALAYIHRMGVVHRDIKADNILVGRYSEEFIILKLADFGLCEIMFSPELLNKMELSQNIQKRLNKSNKLMTMKCGTPGYFAPEIFLESSGYTEKVDVFSMGAVFYNLVTK
jgi:serine/threonine protein kinase